ncbi:MAG: mechanosensitive ion channel family protein [Pseudomonadota bacterium]
MREFLVLPSGQEGPPAFEFSGEGLSETAAYYGEAIINAAIGFAPKLLAAGLVLWIGSWLAGRIHDAVRARTDSIERIDTTLGAFLANAVRYALMGGVVLLAVSILGVEIASIFVVFSAMTLAIGLALQGSMSNVAAGLLLIVLRPYRIGDYVELSGEEGHVEDQNIFQTTLRTLDNVKVILTNNDVRGATIRNYTSLAVRRVDIDFGIDYGDDIGAAMRIIEREAAAHPAVLDEPSKPWTRVSCLNDSSVDIQMRVWCKSADYWDVRFDLLRSVKEAFDAGGISIPFPHVVEIEKVVAPK